MAKNVRDLAEETAEAARLYVRAEADQLKLKVARFIATFSGQIAAALVIILNLLLVLIFAGIALALWFQNWVSSPLAYLLVAAVYALLAVIFFLLRKSLVTNSVLKSVIKEMFDEPQV